jgi:hypothetical protein
MTAIQPDESGISRTNLVGGAIVLALILVATGVLAWRLLAGPGRGEGPVRSVYFPGVTQVGAGTEVLFQGAHVGEVVRTAPPHLGLQLLVTSSVAPGLSQIVTLFPGQTIRVVAPSEAGVMTIALPSLTEATLQHGRGSYALYRLKPNHWTLDQSASRDTLTLNGIALARKPDTATVKTGDLLAIGAVQVEWQDISEYGRVDVRISQKKLAKAAGVPDTTSTSFLLGSRSSLGIASLFGLGKPALRLEPSLGRQPFVLGDERVIAPAPTLDLERSVQGMITYLNSPAALRRIPANRFEKVVSDLNLGLAQVAQLGVRLDTILRLAEGVSRQTGGQGMIGRLVLTPSALDNLDATAARIASGAVPLADTSRSVLARLKLDSLEATATRAIITADRALARTDTAVGKIGITVDSLAIIVRDSLPPLVEGMNRFLDQGRGTAKELQNWIVPVAIGGGVVSVFGILAMLGVF